MYNTNTVLSQDMVSHAFQRFLDTGLILPPRQRRIYECLAYETGNQFILEAGCGIGLGTAILKRLDKPFIYKGEVVQRIAIGTDVNLSHIEFARQMQPACKFDLWDITQGPYPGKLYDVVIAVEVIEHVKDVEEALHNLYLTARNEVWFSTPNRNSSEISDERPRNLHHVREYTPQEIINMVSYAEVGLFHWDGLTSLRLDTEVTPVVYRISV